jgi:hypothetical protein
MLEYSRSQDGGCPRGLRSPAQIRTQCPRSSESRTGGPRERSGPHAGRRRQHFMLASEVRWIGGQPNISPTTCRWFSAPTIARRSRRRLVRSPRQSGPNRRRWRRRPELLRRISQVCILVVWQKRGVSLVKKGILFHTPCSILLLPAGVAGASPKARSCPTSSSTRASASQSKRTSQRAGGYLSQFGKAGLDCRGEPVRRPNTDARSGMRTIAGRGMRTIKEQVYDSE